MKIILPNDEVQEMTDRSPSTPSVNRGLVPHGMVVHPSQVAPESLSSHSPAGVRVLVADDYEDTAESLAMLLTQAGFDAQAVTRGDEALTCAMRWHPHICVLDIEMPGYDGCEVARRIRGCGWGERPLLIALTGWTSSQQRRRTMQVGFDYHLIKPVDPARLVRIIQQVPVGMSIS